MICCNKGYGSVYTIEEGEGWDFSQTFFKQVFNQSYCWFSLSPMSALRSDPITISLFSALIQSRGLSIICTLTITNSIPLPCNPDWPLQSLLSTCSRHFRPNSSLLAPSPRLTFFFSSLLISAAVKTFLPVAQAKTVGVLLNSSFSFTCRK